MPLKPRNSTGIPQDVFDNIKRFSQFSAAAYCPENSDNKFHKGGEKLKCSAGNCPLVEKDDVRRILGIEDKKETGVKGYIGMDRTNDLTVVAFRGSLSVMSWVTDFRASQALNATKILNDVKNGNDTNPSKGTDLCDSCTAHKGFWESWKQAREAVLDTIDFCLKEYPKNRVVLTGHSAGGAIATLAAAEIKKRAHDRKKSIKCDLYTYGAPRVGGKKISDFITNQGMGDIYRVTHRNDMVPRLPPREFQYILYKYDHISPEYYISSGNEEPKPSDITRYDQPAKDKGNGHWHWSELDPFKAHWIYFENVLKCKPRWMGIWKT